MAAAQATPLGRTNEDDHKDEMVEIIENSDSQFVAVADARRRTACGIS